MVILEKICKLKKLFYNLLSKGLYKLCLEMIIVIWLYENFLGVEV